LEGSLVRVRTFIVMLACLAATALVGVVAPPSVAGHRVTLDPPRVQQTVAVYRGHARANTRVLLQRRTPGGWVRVAATRADDRGVYRMTTRSPAVPWRVRTLVKGDRSPVRRVIPPEPDDPTSPEVPEVPQVVPTDACGERPDKADGSLWACTFHDDFDGTALDPDKWLVQETWYSGMTTAHGDCYVNNAETVAVSDGSLRLTARRGLEPFLCKSPYGDFTTTSTAATVASWGRFNQTYGRFEFRAKLPDMAGIPGTGSGLWMYPQTHTYGVWPRSGEIDVAEWFSGRPDPVHASVHYEGEDPAQSSRACAMTEVGTRFHTYAVEWTPTLMRFFYDDELCFEHTWTPTGLTGSQPFDHPFYLVMTEAWGALWNSPTEATPMTSTMTIDWVRAWE
jgi:beta-glucanase (GH16 family)